MGRGRAPCCAKVGLNKGSWTPEEDMRLIAYIHKHGHGNWRALPKLAGLLRCGKSCRLRWINYLRPDVKRGNFTKEEEDTIIKLHGSLGNKWSKIASCLPGRTDNEIKNVWNTHLKKRYAPRDQQKPTRQKAEEPPSSPLSIATASVSCSDEGDTSLDQAARGEEIDRIEIHIEPSLDLWDMLQDSSLQEPPQDQMTVEPCSSSDMGLEDSDPLIPIEQDIWTMMDDDLNNIVDAKDRTSTTPRATSDDHYQNSASMNLEAESSGGDESERWLQYLEKELDLWGEGSTTGTTADMEGGDPVASYFHEVQSSPSPLDL